VSLLKIWATETHEKASLLLLDAAGEQAGTAGAAAFLGAGQGLVDEAGERVVTVDDLQMPLYNAAAAKIFSGTNEIQRNILAKVVLALPVS